MAVDSITKLQDCNLIAQAFERGAVHDTSEASVFAPLARHNSNMGNFANGVQNVLSQYSVNKPTNLETQGIQINDQFVTVPVLGTTLSRAIKDCIPCSFRPLSSVDLSLGSKMLDALKADVKRRLDILNQIANLFTNVDTYADYCQMVSFLNFMCVPDLQRMIAILASILTALASDLITFNGLLQALIAPFFLPVLLSMQALLDQFVQLVLSPLNCIITSIQSNIRKINIEQITGDPTLTNTSQNLNLLQRKASLTANQIQGQVRSGLLELSTLLDEGNQLLRNKLDFYTKQLTKILSSFGVNTASTISTSNKKLVILRLIGLIQAVIKTRNQNIDICKQGSTPAANELNNFFNNFISPTSPFNLSIDPDGNLHVEEKNPSIPNSVNIQAQKLLPVIFSPVSQVFPKCQLATTAADIDKVNLWISQLNNV